MIKKIIFRADGNSDIGLGHLYRIFSLIEIYKENFDFIILTKANSTLEVIPADYNVTTIPSSLFINDEPKWILRRFSPEEYIIIADGYHFLGNYQKAIKNAGYFLIYIDDLVTGHYFADIVINHSSFTSSKEYKMESYTRLALGTHYAILRPSFLKIASQKRKVEKIDSCFICFGGADIYDLSEKAVLALLTINGIKKINVVLGGAYKHKKIFKIKSKDVTINIYENLDQLKLLKVMEECNFAIVSTSNISYEIFTVNMPVLGGYYTENQKFFYKGLVMRNVIFGGGNFEKYKVKDFSNKVKKIINQNTYNNYCENQFKFFDGKIKEIFIKLLENINKIKIRKVNIGDKDLVYNWANDKLVREQSFFTAPISYDVHCKWFKNQLHDKNHLFFIITINNMNAGIVRFKIKLKSSAIGLSISKEFRGKNLGTKFIKIATNEYFKSNELPILAHIKKNNIASIKIFERASFVYLKEELIEGNESFTYILENKYK